MKSSPPWLYEYGSVRSGGGRAGGWIVKVAGNIRFSPAGSISTPAARPPENGKRSMRDTGVTVTISGDASAFGGTSSVKTVPSAPVTERAPPVESRSADAAFAESRTEETE